MHDQYKLAQDKHERIYKKIERRTFSETAPVDKPRIVISGGQPGSGKSRLIEMSKKDFPDGNVVVINGDDVRRYHPKAEQILKTDDKRFSDLTDPDSREWTRKLLEHAIETQRNIIFESTMRDQETLSKTLIRLKENGYQITARALACHERMSKTGVFLRYETQKADKGGGRFTPMAVHDAGYEGMPKTIEHIEKNKLADKVEVYDRSANLLYSNELKDNRWQREPNAREHVEIERSRQPTPDEIDQLERTWKRIYYLMDQRSASLPERDQARKIYEKIKRGLGKRHHI